MATICGGCHCGAVRYELSEPPKGGTACHCKACQRRTGGDYGVSMWVDPDTVVSFTGPTRTFVRIADSGNEVRYEFCERCGTTLRWAVPPLGNRLVYAGGTLDDANLLDVVGEMYTDEAGPRGLLGCNLVTSDSPTADWRSAVEEQILGTK